MSPPRNDVGISSDRPIESKIDDKLGRKTFARHLANALTNWDGNESIVIAVYGPWGSGKTSVKNMTIEELRDRYELDREAGAVCSIIEFNPWMWSGERELHEAFFAEIGEALGVQCDDGRDVGQKFKEYGAKLALAGTTLGIAKTAAGLLGVPGLPIVLDMLGHAADNSSAVAEQAADALPAIEQGGTLGELKDELAKSLSALSRPLYVVLDDIDRLTNNEIRLLFRLVKANADFPNLVYLMLFDRKVVEAALSKDAAISGSEYLEKIVQVGLDVPQLQQKHLDSLFFEKLREILSRHQLIADFDESRWRRVYSHLRSDFITSPRDAVRLTSALSFTLGMFVEGGQLNVNLTDLICLEALRVMEPRFYSELARHRDFLTIGLMLSAAPPGRTDLQRKLLDDLIEHCSEGRRGSVSSILKELFPRIKNAFFGMSLDREVVGTWEMELRVCSFSTWSRYFVMCVPDDEVSEADIEYVLSASFDATLMQDRILSVRSKTTLPPLCYRLATGFRGVAISTEKNAIVALSNVMDELDPLDENDAVLNSLQFVTSCLDQIEDTEKRIVALSDAIKETTGLLLPLFAVNYLEATGESESDRPFFHSYISDGTRGGAQQVLKERVRDVAEKGSLQVGAMRLALNAYHEWSSEDDNWALEWARRFAQTPENALNLAIAFAHTTVSIGGEVGEFNEETKTTLRKNGQGRFEIDVYLSLDELVDRLKPVFDTSDETYGALREKYSHVRDAVRRAAESAGSVDDG